MKPNSLKYILVYITPLVVTLSLSFASEWSYFALFFIFAIIPILELFTKRDVENLDAIQEDMAKKNKIYDYLLYGLVPFQYFILVYFLYQVSNENLTLWVRIGLTTAFGISCGVLGINAAHELGHRTTKFEQALGKLLLLSTLYMHFFIEHNRGHHKNVSTENDPASSRYGETVYLFYLRSIFKGWLSAWKLESEKLAAKKQAFWSINNEMLQFQVFQSILIIVIYFIFGLSTVLFFLTAALIGIILLETVNYIEHYGLKRKIKGDRYERTLPIHSWNSNHPIGRLLMLELSRHSDHHYISSRKYQLLRHHQESPQMPTGYPGMMLLALVPPLWFYVMNKKIAKFQLDPINETLAQTSQQ